MNKEILEHHCRHFGQAQLTPFTVSLLKEQIGDTTEGPLVRKLKDGTAKVEDLDLEEHITDILKEFTWKDHYPPKNLAKVDWMQLRQGFKLWNEKMAKSPLERYLGKYKAWIQKKAVEEKEREDGSKIGQEEFFTSINNVLRTAKLQMTPLKIWLPVHNLFILQEA
eukprot:1842696-Ditylum_brightwellii.AAC.1